MNLFFALSFFWFIRIIKNILFWLYLWQLKDYHIGRFLDHFQTEKGRRALLNPLLVFKIILIFIALFAVSSLWIDYNFPHFDITLYILNYLPLFFFASVLIYLIENLFMARDVFQKRLKRPVWTKKTIILFLFNIFIYIIFFTCVYLFVAKINFVQLRFESVLPVFGVFSPIFSAGLILLITLDTLSPILVSLAVLIFQPLAVLGRNRIIKRAEEKRAVFHDLLVIGITGSYGKTSTKEFLYTILVEKFGPEKVLKTKEHQNSEVGISRCILNDLKPGHEVFICEMGALGRGGIKLLCDIVKPKIGILTGINEQHMATFGSQENIIQAKYELIEGLPKDGLAIFNGDNEYCFELYKKTQKPKKFYSLQSTIFNAQPDLWAASLAVNRQFLSFETFDKNGELTVFKANVMGGQNVYNILAAAICAKELGMTLEEIARACRKIEPKHGAMRLKEGINGIIVVDSTYSANPDGVIADLDYINIYPSFNKKIIIMPCLIELGKASKKVHKKIGRKIGEICDLAIITTRERFEEIGTGAIETGMNNENILFTESPKEIFEKIKSSCQKGDVVLLESRVPSLLKDLLIDKTI